LGKTIGGNDWDFANSIQQTLDGGFIIGGTTYSYGKGNADGYVVKLMHIRRSNME